MNSREIELKIYELNENNEKIVKETKIVRFRLLSKDCVNLETEKKMTMMEFIQNESVSMVVTMLKYMRISEDRNFSLDNAYELYDLLIENGWSYKKIIQDIIYETLVTSGFLEQSEWEEMKKDTEEIIKKMKAEKQKALAKL